MPAFLIVIVNCFQGKYALYKKNCDFRHFPQMTFNPNIAKTAP